MLRVAIGKTGDLSSVSRDGKLLPVKEAHIHMTLRESIFHMILIEWDGEGSSERDEVVRFSEEPIELLVVE